MAMQHDRPTAFRFPASPAAAMPLTALSPERINAHHQSPLQTQYTPASPASPTTKPFGHPELGPPGDFSKFSPSKEMAFQAPPESAIVESSSGGSDSERKPPSPVRFGQSMFGQAPAGNLKKVDVTNWTPTKILHSRTSSDVQGMVARFNSLDIRDHAEMRKKEAAALKRAQMGREEAEEEVKRLREEARAMKKDIDEGKERERRVAKRLDVVIDDLHRSKETQAHAQTLYEKEVKKARKEAFKASSNMVKLQEELKTARKALAAVQSDLDLERIKLSRKEQDTFAAQYELVGAQQELEQAQSRIKISEEERDALKTSLKEEEVARIAAEGRIALPPSKVDDDDEFASPKKQRQLPPKPSPTKELALPKPDIATLRTELERQVRRTKAAEDQVDFMKMECQFGCCSCRMAQQPNDNPYVHDGSLEAEVQKFKDAIAAVLTPPPSESMDTDTGLVAQDQTMATAPITVETNLPEDEQEPKEQIAFSPDTGTFHSFPSAIIFSPPQQTAISREPDTADFNILHENHSAEPTISNESKDTNTNIAHHANPAEPVFSYEPSTAAHDKHYASSNSQGFESYQPDESSLPAAAIPSAAVAESTYYRSHAEEPEQGSHDAEYDNQSYSEQYEMYNPEEYNDTYRTVTTTTTIPLVDASSTPDYRSFFSPMTLTREEAIEQLRLRRGRARSAAGTPRKPLADTTTPRRDISAPEVKGKSTPKFGSKEKERRR